jgi:hypothetical protein
MALSSEAMAKMAGAAHASDVVEGGLLTPYLSIVQQISGYMKRTSPDYIEDAREGDIIDTLNLKLRAAAAFIVAKYEVHYTTWKPNNGPLVKQHFTDPSAYKRAQWKVVNGETREFGPKTDADGNDVVPSMVYYGLLLADEQGFSQPIIVALSGTQYGKARRWNALINFEMVGPDGKPFIAPNFARIYHLTTVPETGGPGGDKSWAGWKIEPGPFTLNHPKFGEVWFAKASEFRKAVEDGLVRPMPPRENLAEDQQPARPAAGQQSAGESEDIPF